MWLIETVRQAKIAVRSYFDLCENRTDREYVEMEAWNSLTDAQRGAVFSMAKSAGVAAQGMAYLLGRPYP
jgi:hypothetical protein